MVNSTKLYGQEFDPSVLRDLKHINEELKKTVDSEEILKLRMQRLYRGMEMTSIPMTRNYRGYYPY